MSIFQSGLPSWAVIGLMAVAFGVAAATTRWLVTALTREGVMDKPNARSSHTAPTPRGGGLGLLAGLVPAWAVIVWWTGVGTGYGGLGLTAGLLILAVVSWRDDRGGLPWRVRLAAQALAVLLGLLFFLPVLLYAPDATRQFLAVLFFGVAAILWIGFLNAFNFMDGIDGIAAVEAISIAAGLAIAFVVIGAHPAFALFSGTLAAAAAGFLVWNRAPARIFMGDVGSIPLGFLLGFLLITLAVSGAWGAALVLPAYFGADTVVTMFRRWRRGEKLTEAHRSHAYQRAAGREKPGHARVVRRVALSNGLLILASVVGLLVGGTGGQVLTLVLGVVVVLELMWALERMAAEREALVA